MPGIDDFAFVFGVSKGNFAETVRQLFGSKTPPVELIDRKELDGARIRTLHDCISYLTTTPAPTVILPIGNLFLSSHAGKSSISMPMYRGQVEDSTTYEVLEDTMKVRDTGQPAPPENSVDMTPILLPDPTEHAVQVRGCNIGKADAFMILWKKALGNEVKLIAPKHFDGLVPVAGYGIWEYLCYQFELSSPTALSGKKLRAAFQDKAATIPAPFVFIDGSTVPPDYWKDPNWYSPDLPDDNPQSTAMALPASVGRNSKTKRKSTIFVARGLLTHPDKTQLLIPYDAAADVPNPDNQDDCKASMKVSLPIFDERWKTTHPFPMWTRLGFANIDEFIAGWTWRFSKTKDKDHDFLLNCRGTRVVYTVVQAITDPNPTPDPKVGKVRANFYPKINFDKIPSEPLPPDGLDLTSDKLFLTV